MKTKRLLLIALFGIITLFAFMVQDSRESSAAVLSQFVSPLPVNDNFADATIVSGIPYNDFQETQNTTTEPGEQSSNCNYYGASRTIWYSYTPTQDRLVSSSIGAYYQAVLSVYAGSALNNLTLLGCNDNYNSGRVTFAAQAGVTYYFQVSSMYGDGGYTWFYLDDAPAPVASFYYYAYDPSIYTNIQFYNYSYDPANLGISSWIWDFGDGSTSTDHDPVHQYSADGDYIITLTVTTPDGRTASTSQGISVRTHDVAITKFTVPNSASAGQTKQIVVGLNSKLMTEQVRVEIYKSVPGGYEWFGTSIQQVPVRSANRTTDFNFSYTFTSEDAKIGKVTFKAVASFDYANDALPADNQAISSPVKIGGKGGKDGSALFEDTSTTDAFTYSSTEPATNDGAATKTLFLPLISSQD